MQGEYGKLEITGSLKHRRYLENNLHKSCTAAKPAAPYAK